MRAMIRHKRLAHRRGAALVEMAIVLVLLLMITLGAIEYGWLFLQMQRITNAARHGARVAAALGATDLEGTTAAQSLVGGINPAPTCDVTTDWDANLVTAEVSVPTGRGGGAGVSLINWNLLPAPNELRVVVTLAKETPPMETPPI